MTTTDFKLRRWIFSLKNTSSETTTTQVYTLGLVFVGLCVLLGTALRGFHLGTQNFWYDEMESIRYAVDLSLRDIHPPTYYYLLRGALLLGQSEFIVRFVSFIPGVLSIPLAYVIGKRLLSNSAALIATFLVSISPILIWHAQDARMYSQLVFGCLLMVYMYLRALEKNDWKFWAGYILAALLALYTQLYAILLVGTLGLHFLLFHRRFITRWFVTNLVLGLAYLPWIIIMIGMPEEKIGGRQISALFRLPYNYFAFINGYSLGPPIPQLRSLSLDVLAPYRVLIAPIFLISALLFVMGVDRLRRESLDKLTLLLGWVFLPVLIAVIIPYLHPSMTFNVRYVLFSVPALLFIFAAGITHSKRRYVGMIFLAIFTFYNAMSLHNNTYDPTYAREDVRGAAQYVASEIQPDDHILVATVGRIFDWYFTRGNVVVSNVPTQPALTLVDQAADGAASLWFVKSRPWQTDPDNELETLLKSRYVLLSTVEFPGVSVYHYCLINCVGS